MHVHRGLLWTPQRRHSCGKMERPESRSLWMRSLRYTGVWPSLARSARWLVAAAVRYLSVDVGRGVGRVHGRVLPVRPRMVQLCLLCDRTLCLHCAGPQVEVPVTTGDYVLGVAGTRQRVLQDGVLRRCRVRHVQQRVAVVGGNPGKPKWLPGVLSAHAQAVLKPSQGHPVDRLRRLAGTPVAHSRFACRKRWRMTWASTVWTHGLWMPYCMGREAATPSPSGTVPEMATAHLGVRSAARATLVACLQGPPPHTSQNVWPQASGIQ